MGLRTVTDDAPTPRETADESLNDLLARAVEHVKAMTPEEREAMHERQKKAWVAAEMAIGDEGTRIVTGHRETADHAELARLAEAATPGPWRTDENSVWGACDPDDTTSRGMGVSILDCRTNAPRWARADLDYRKSVDNAAFIAAASPTTVLALLSEIAALRGERDELFVEFRAVCEERTKEADAVHDERRRGQEIINERDRWIVELIWERDVNADRATQAERQRDELRKALERIRDLGSDGEHSGDRHARCRDIARQALANQGAE